MPLQATSGAASYDGFGGGVVAEPNYIESCFSTYLYTGTSSAQTITNGIDLSGKGGLVWIKDRSADRSHCLADTANGAYYNLFSDLTNGLSGPDFQRLTAFNSNGFSIGSAGLVNNNGGNYASWTFRKQPKFFDVVTYTGDLIAGKTVAHNLGSVPGCIIVKRTNSTDSFWRVYHRSLTATNNLKLNLTDASVAQSTIWNDTEPTSTHFTVGTNGNVNQSGDTYVAYLFAHNAGGFGLTGTDNVISCGSFTTDAVNGNASVNLGYEPQWLLVKTTAESGNWRIVDNMRGMTVGYSNAILSANLSNAESTGSFFAPSATGFEATGLGASVPCIYIAIRRGPMKVPTSGTSVFAPVAYTGDSTNNRILTTGFASDAVIITKKSQSSYGREFTSTLTAYREIFANLTDAETADTAMKTANTGLSVSNTGHFQMSVNSTGETYIAEIFGRAPGFFDEVCAQGNYNGLSTPGTPHNLGVKPELVIQKSRNNATTWNVVDWNSSSQRRLVLNTTAASDDISADLPQATSSVFYSYFNSTHNCVNYLFASCPGVSKVGSYTGTATTKQIDCGFTGGARFVLIKRTDSTGDWYIWDTARGIVSGNDSYLLLNTTAAEVTNTDYIDTYSAGFEISSTAPAAINASGGTFIFFAVS
jgi:hypothetical protein